MRALSPCRGQAARHTSGQQHQLTVWRPAAVHLAAQRQCSVIPGDAGMPSMDSVPSVPLQTQAASPQSSLQQRPSHLLMPCGCRPSQH